MFSVGRQGSQEFLQIDEAIEQHRLGNRVTFLYCDDKVGGCNENPLFDKRICKFCIWNQKRFQNKYLPKNIKRISIKEIIGNDEIFYPNYEYSNIDELKTIKYHDVEIGMGAVSTYISQTRNIAPIINCESKKYFDTLLNSEVRITYAIEKYLKDHNVKLMVFHNGRFATFKPFLNIASNRGINFVCTESYTDKEGNVSKDYYFNDIPHNITPRHKKYIQVCQQAEEEFKDVKELGKVFFERRRCAQNTGDKIYTAGQSKDEFVDDWDSTKENIVIFNSSEDEFFSVGSEYERAKLFKNQIEGIRSIMNHYKNDSSKHFYLRIHPNLISVKHSFHLDLYKLNYPNLTVIPANSRISSYLLMDKADKVITFGSTMGIEATYARKPSICIGASLYELLDVAYHPKNIEELWSLIDTRQLKDLFNDNIYIYGYYFIGRYESFFYDYCRNIDIKVSNIKIFNKKYSLLNNEKICGSTILYLIIRNLWRRYCRLYAAGMHLPE